MTRILLTGASSFTGSWLATALAARGAEIIAPLARTATAGDERRQACLARAAKAARIMPSCPFGTPEFLELIHNHGPFDLAILHGAEVGEFRDVPFDIASAVASTTNGAEQSFARLAATGCRRVVITGSVFEADEGLGDHPFDAIGDYGLAKTLSWQILRHAARKEKMALGKFTIPHPFGADERPGLVSHLINSWRRGEVAHIDYPELVRDMIHVDLLAEIYARFALALPTKAGLYRRGPGGYRERLADFAQRLACEMRPRLGWPCALGSMQPERVSEEPIRRHNTDVTNGFEDRWAYANSWDLLAEFYAPTEFNQSMKTIESIN